MKRLNPSAVYLATLCMSMDNVDSIVNLVDYLGAGRVRLVVSHYFQGVERHKLIPKMEAEFTGRPIEIAVLASHAKICLIRSALGDAVIMGSANLSSSNNVESFVILHDPSVVDWYQDRLDNIFDRFTVFRGLDGYSNHTRRRNTGKDAYFAMMERRFSNGTDDRSRRQQLERGEGRRREVPPGSVRPGGTPDD